MERATGPILNAEEVASAQKVIDATRPGVYTLKRLFGNSWPGGSEGQYYGLKFKAALEQGLLYRVAYAGDTSAHAAKYSITR